MAIRFRPPRILHPWDQPANRELELVVQAINDFIQELDSLTSSISTAVSGITTSGAVAGDILVYKNNLLGWRPQKYVPLNLGVGLSGDPTYRFQVADGPISFHITQQTSGGAYGTTLNKDVSGTARVSHLFASGGTVHWEVGLNTNGDFLVRDHRAPRNVFWATPGGVAALSGDIYLFGNVTSGPLIANSVNTSGNAVVSGSAGVSGDIWLRGALKILRPSDGAICLTAVSSGSDILLANTISSGHINLDTNGGNVITDSPIRWNGVPALFTQGSQTVVHGGNVASASVYQNRHIRLTGLVITGTVTFTLPASAHAEWVIINDCTAGVTGDVFITVKTAVGIGVDVPVSTTQIVRCDGTNIVAVSSDSGAAAAALEIGEDAAANSVVINPDSSARNTITPAGDFTPLILQGAGDGTANLFEIYDAFLVPVLEMNAFGSWSILGPALIGEIGSPHNSAALEIRSTVTGFLPPRMTTTERNNIFDPASGLVIFNGTTQRLNFRTASDWEVVPAEDDLVLLSPATATRNRIEPTADVVPFTIRGSSGHSANMLLLENNSGTDLAWFDASGNLLSTGYVLARGTLPAASFVGVMIGKASTSISRISMYNGSVEWKIEIASTDRFRLLDNGNSTRMEISTSDFRLPNISAVIGASAAGTTPDASSVLDLVSTSKGFLPPRMTNTQRNNISSPATALMVYNSTNNRYNGYNGTSWRELAWVLIGTATWNPASIADGASASTDVTVTGAAVGDPCSVGFTSIAAAGWRITANVRAADTVSVFLTNNTGGAVDLASGTVTVFVWKT